MTIKIRKLEDMIADFMKQQEKYEVKIGYFEDESTEPSYDEACTCPLCNESTIDSVRPTKTILIHCTRWPLATFMRFHAEELNNVMETRYHEIIADALAERARIELDRKKVPDIFRRAFT